VGRLGRMIGRMTERVSDLRIVRLSVRVGPGRAMPAPEVVPVVKLVGHDSVHRRSDPDPRAEPRALLIADRSLTIDPFGRGRPQSSDQGAAPRIRLWSRIWIRRTSIPRSAVN
jgi:hypothetical protein